MHRNQICSLLFLPFLLLRKRAQGLQTGARAFGLFCAGGAVARRADRARLLLQK